MAADDLGAQDAVVRRVHEELHRHAFGAGEVAGVIGGVRVQHAVRSILGSQARLAGPHAGDDEIENAEDRHARCRVGGIDGIRPERDDVGGGAAVAVGETRHRDQPRFARDRIDLLHGVADGEDPRVGGALPRIDGDAARGSEREPRGRGQCRVGAGSPRVDHHLGVDPRAGGQGDAGGGHSGDLIGEVQVDVVLPQLFDQGPGHLGVQRTEGVRSAVHERDPDAAAREVLDGFEADESTAGHHGARRARIEPGDDAVDVVDRAEGEDGDRVVVGGRRIDGHGPRRKDEVVVDERLDDVGVEVAHVCRVGGRVDADDLVSHADVEREPAAQAVGRLHEECGSIGDLAADVVRQAAVREAHVRAALHDDDLVVVVESAKARRGGRPARDAADDDGAGHGHRPNRRAHSPPLSARSWPGQRSARGTPAMTMSMCWPHPAQVVFPQVRQVTARHMSFSFFRRTHPNRYPRGYSSRDVRRRA